MNCLKTEIDAIGIAQYFQEDLRTVEIIIFLCNSFPNNPVQVMKELQKRFIPLSHRVYLILGYIIGLMVAANESNQLIKHILSPCQRQN